MNESLIRRAFTFWIAKHSAFSLIGIALSLLINKLLNYSLLNNSNSMSIYQTLSTYPPSYSTSDQLPLQNFILTLKEIDEKLHSLTVDIYSMFSVAQQIKNTIMHLNCSLDYFQKYGIRLMSIINCIFEKYGMEPYHLSKLLKCIAYCDNEWKQHLIRTIKLLNNYPSAHSIFIYKTNRNIYLWAMLRANNTILTKMVGKMIEKKKLNGKAISYLKQNNVFTFYSNIYNKIVQILQEKEEQTYLKILLINQFIKYILLFAYLSPKNTDTIFSNFFVLIEYSCRLMKKQYSGKIRDHIKQALKVIKKGLNLYIKISQKDPLNKVRVQQIRHIISIISGAPIQVAPIQNINQNMFTMRLIFRILNSWKKIHSQAQKMKSITISRSTKEMSLNQFAKKEKENQLKLKMEKGKIDQIKEQFMKLNKSRTNLCRRKSHSLKSDPFIKTNLASMQNKIKIRREIQGHGNKHFSKLDGLKIGRSLSYKDQKSLKKEQKGEREMKLEDYSNHMQSRMKIVPNSNKIQLYRADKMAQFYKKQGKVRLQLSTNS